MQEQEFIRKIRTIDCNSLDKYTQTMICLEMTVLFYYLKDSVNQQYHNHHANIDFIYEQLQANSLDSSPLTRNEFDMLFSNFIFYNTSSNEDIKKYIESIIYFISHDCAPYFNSLSIHNLIDLFTHIIEQLHPHIQKQYTPSEIVELMGGIIQAQNGESFSDPACGSGEFISEMIKNNVHIHGAESNMDRLKITRTKMLVSGITPSNITSTYFDEKNSFEEKFDFILSNPPFSLKNPVGKENNFCIYGEPPASNADFAFLQYFIYKLKDNGRAAIILPDGILFRSGKEHEIRRKIIKENHITAIIYLPRGVFKNTTIATNIIVLKKDNKPCDLFIIDAREKHTFNDDLILRLFIDRQETEISRIISMEEIDNNNYDLSASLYFKRKNNEPSLELIMQKQNELEEKLYSLQHDFQAQIVQLIKKVI